MILPDKASVPTARQAAALFLKRREKLTADQEAYLDRLGTQDKASADAYQLTQRGPYWYFHFRERGRQKTIYVGQTDNPEARVDEIMTKEE